MVDYSGLIDQQISEILTLKGRVTVEQLPGLSEDDALGMLRRYALIHGHERAMMIDGRALRWAAPVADAGQGTSVPGVPGIAEGSSPTPQGIPLSPVDQVLAAPAGKSALDFDRSEARVNKAMFALPVALALPGGIIAWLVTRKESPRAARWMLIIGVAVTLISVVSGAAIGPMLGKVSGDSSTGDVQWAASSNGRPTFYYFGRATEPASREMNPLIDTLANEYAGRVDFVLYSDLNSDATAASFAQAQGVESEPSMVLVASTGKEIQRWSGAQPLDELDVAVGNAASR